MKTEPSKWRVEEHVGESTRSVVVEASSWEAALESVWKDWELPHDLQRAGIEVGLSATQVFIRGTSQRYRVALERQAPKRTVPRPASSIPPAMAGPPPVPKKVEPKKPEPKKPEPRRANALPSGRSLFGKLPRASSPDLGEHARPPSRASRPDETELRASRPDETELRASRPDETELERPVSPSIVPTPVVDIGVPTPPPPPPPRSPAPPSRPLPNVDVRRLQVLVTGSVQLFTREQDPKNGAPVIYRQHGYALPMGTEEEEAEAFARWMLGQLKTKVPEGIAPRLFHVAVYDEMFTGEPPVLALCKLEWKEWKNEINVSFPRRGDDSVVVEAPRARTPSMHPPDMTAASHAPGSPPAQAAKLPGRAASLFLPPVTPPAFAVQPPPRVPSGLGDDLVPPSDSSSED